MESRQRLCLHVGRQRTRLLGVAPRERLSGPAAVCTSFHDRTHLGGPTHFFQRHPGAGCPAGHRRPFSQLGKGHMRALPLPGTRIIELLEHFRPLGKAVRDIEAQGWASFLERSEGVGVPMLSKQHPCHRCRQPQTPCRAGEGDPVADRPDGLTSLPLVCKIVPLSNMAC